MTLEPCAMCAGAIVLSRVSRLVFGAWDSRSGACGSQFDVPGAGLLGDVLVRPEVREERCSELLSDWFRRRRGAAPDGLENREPGADPGEAGST